MVIIPYSNLSQHFITTTFNQFFVYEIHLDFESKYSYFYKISLSHQHKKRIFLMTGLRFTDIWT